ncbi:MAG TPA: hypothetical protein VNL16_01600 [Chloroflexota bacterium]|nr:hypothetical protein [Chloroflexota bacterium]
MEERLPRPPSQWDDYVERARQQLPAGPPSLLNGYVRFAPWVALVFGVFGVLALLALGGILAVLSPVLLLGGASGVGAGADAFLAIAVGLVLAVLELAGGYLMLKRSATGWWLIGLGIAVSAISDLLHVAIFGLIIVLLIAWIHIQVRPQYN